MKVFRLSCSRHHAFEGWFASSEEFERQQAGGEIRCPFCESRSVKRLPSAPYVNTGGHETRTMPVAARPGAGAQDLATAIAALKAYVVANTEDVGRQFSEVARRMHYGEESQRGIRGRVTVDEAETLRDEGIEAVPLPPGIFRDEKLH